MESRSDLRLSVDDSLINAAQVGTCLDGRRFQ